LSVFGTKRNKCVLYSECYRSGKSHLFFLSFGHLGHLAPFSSTHATRLIPIPFMMGMIRACGSPPNHNHVPQPRPSTASLNRVPQPRPSTASLNHYSQPRPSTTILNRVPQPRPSTTILNRVPQPQRAFERLSCCRVGKNLAGQLNYMGFFSFMYSERSVISGENTEFPPQLPQGLMRKHDAPDGQHPSLKFWFTPEALQQQVRRRLISPLKFSPPFMPRAKFGPRHCRSPSPHRLFGIPMGGNNQVTNFPSAGLSYWRQGHNVVERCKHLRAWASRPVHIRCCP
jgi:hypothetical protein